MTSLLSRRVYCFLIIAGGLAASLAVFSSASAEDTPADASTITNLARNDPFAFLESCLKHYDRDVRGYTMTMQKQERLQGRLQNKEVIEIAFKDQPHSVSLHWLQGARKADRVIYVAGENDGQMLAHPTGAAGMLVKVVRRKVDSEEARQSARYTLDQFGFKNTLNRAITSMQAAQKKGTLRLEFQGEAKVIEAGQRVCYKIKRTYSEPEADGTQELTLYVDRENYLPIGVVVKGKVEPESGNRELLGEYFFRDVRLNPEFTPNQFKETSFN
jgi:hypothetical protein